MTGRTHDLAAFATLSYAITLMPDHSISLATAITALGANFIGGLTPDIDQPTADLWQRIPAGTVFSRIVSPFLGGHRTISHSLFGMALIGGLVGYILTLTSTVVLVDMWIVWLAFMIGYASHLVADSVTKEGVPLLFPLPINVGFPPFESWRMKSGGFFEKSVVFPSLLVITTFIYIYHYQEILIFIRNLQF